MSGLTVALDGPGSSGKSSVGAAAAARLGYRFLDTGVVYRAITLAAVVRGIEPTDGEALAAVVPQIGLLADDAGALRRVTLAGEEVTGRIHVPEVDRDVSAVSAQPELRAALLDLQREIAAPGSVILAGRDIGTVVLPDADLKLFLEVSAQERARRRAEERGLDPDSEEAARILAELQRRDHLDGSRKVGTHAGAPRCGHRPLGWPRLRAGRGAGRGHHQRASRAGDRHMSDDFQAMSAYPTFIAGLCRFGLQAIGRVKVKGLDDLPQEGPLILAANHMSNVDPPFIGGWLGPALGRRPTFLAKEALFGGPLGMLIRSLGAEPVKAGGNDIGAYRVAKRILDQGGVVAVLPEGTRAFDGVMAEPKPGVSMLATRTGTPVLPVGISGTDELLGREQVLPRIGSRITLRVGRPFQLTIPPGVDRREALAAADEELMRRIAALVEPRHRGRWEPWPEA